MDVSHSSHGSSSSSAPVNNVTQDSLMSSLLKVRHELEVDKIFRALVRLKGSDLHMKVGQTPIVRGIGELRPLNRPPIETEEMVKLLVRMREDRERR